MLQEPICKSKLFYIESSKKLLLDLELSDLFKNEPPYPDEFSYYENEKTLSYQFDAKFNYIHS